MHTALLILLIIDPILVYFALRSGLSRENGYIIVYIVFF
jgi:hypothetical protein